jgi:hypothetical protein
MGDDPDLYRTFVPLDPYGAPGSQAPRRLHHVTLVGVPPPQVGPSRDQ